MSIKSSNNRIIFGLKVKQLRQQKQLSFADLAATSGLSISYLNEIEKGKKYPRKDKILALAKVLEVSPEQLESSHLEGSLAPVGELLKSNFLNELPLELFGIELNKVTEIIAGAPTRVGAFISTLVELGRNYALGEENFYFGVLRSYLEMHENYFEEIENAVDDFSKQHNLTHKLPLPYNNLVNLLRDKYNYKIIENGLDKYPDLQFLRAVYKKKRNELLLNSQLNEGQKLFQLGKELGFSYLQLKDRALTASLLRVRNFEEVLSHFKAGYFSVALLIKRQAFLEDLGQFFQMSEWDGSLLLS